MDTRLAQLDQSLKDHAMSRDFIHAQKIIESVVGLFGVKIGENDWEKPFTDSAGKLRANVSWFMGAPGYADRRATYILAGKNEVNIDFKSYWLKKTNKAVISWLIALTNNFEDKPYNKSFNLGIDFIIPENADKVFVVLSNKYSVRTLELSDKLSQTDLAIFSKWIQPLDYANKDQVHSVLWDSFDFEPVNRVFYKKISELFVDLKQHLVKNDLFDDRHASYFANRLIGRVIFCWFLDKKEIINPKMGYFKTNNQDSTTYYHTKLEPLFFHTLNTPIPLRDGQNIQSQPDMFPDNKPKNLFNYTTDLITPFLNGGLFEPRTNDFAGDPKLTFPADYFDRLYEHLHHYHFTTDESTSDYQQVAIDPEMLGRIFENLLAEQSEETGEQARKAKGAFYTPREIVDYMCRESLREYLRSQLPDSTDRDQRITELLDIKTHEFRDQQRNYRANLTPYKYDLLKALDQLRVLDPACGSGAFPMGMQQLLLSVYERLDNTFDPYKKKLEILKNNIYGVDIEPMAVEISRLRAWLSIIVDQDPKTKVEALPNLDFKFVSANSLLPLAQNGQMSFADHQELEIEQKNIRDAYFGSTDHARKKALKDSFNKLIKEKVIDNLPESPRIIQLKTYNPFDSENVTSFFDPDFMFGFPLFNIILGNPPYIKEYVNKSAFDRLHNSSYYQGKMDIWYMFSCIGIDYLQPNGIECLIAQNNWTTSSGASKMRNKIIDSTKIIKLVDFGNYKIFKSAGIQTMVMIFQKKSSPGTYSFDYRRITSNEAIITDVDDILNHRQNNNIEYLEPRIVRNDYKDKTLNFSSSLLDDILNKIKHISDFSLDAKSEVAQGIVYPQDYVNKKSREILGKSTPVGSGIFAINDKERDLLNLTQSEISLLKPLYTSKEIKRWYGNSRNTEWVIYTDSSFKNKAKMENYPNLKKHLDNLPIHLTPPTISAIL